MAITFLKLPTPQNMNPQIGRTITMTSKQEKILETIIYFLERYKKAVTKSESSTGFEDMVFTEMIDTIKEVRAENKRLSELNKPKILKGEENEFRKQNKALEEKVETMDMLTQSLKSELKKAIEDIEELSAAYDIKLLREGLTDL
jgi:hypothetical protein